MNKLFICLSFLAAVTLNAAASAAASAAPQAVEAEGVSGLSGQDALRQAMRAAVEQAAGVFVHSESEVQNFVLQKEKILSRTEGYITRYTVTRETRANDLFTVKISAMVSTDKIKDDLIALKILVESLARPKLMILIREDAMGMEKTGMRIAETQCASLLGAKGFDLVDQGQFEKVRALDQARQALAGNVTAANRLGLTLGAQYVVLGHAVVQDIGEAFPGSGLRSLQASLQVKVIQTQSGLVLGSAVKTGVAAHVSPLTGATEALKNAAQKAVDGYLVDAITHSFQDFLNNGVPLQLQVTGVKTFQLYKQVSSAIETLDKVVSSKKEAWSQSGGMLVLALRFKGTSEELAELIDGKDFGKGNLLEVVDFAPDRVDGRLK
ncbi:MAG: hypothetical protein Q8P24_18710 [Desulfobacterales bacterium]|nr:hypothetical protein [Desulfobacterales bacterium]